MTPETKNEPQHALPTKSLDEDTNPFTFVFMTYLDSLFSIANKRTLQLEDLGGVAHSNRSEVLYPLFIHHYNKQKHLPLEKKSMWHAIWLTIGYWKLFMGLILFGISAAVQLGPVLILTRLVDYFNGLHDYSRGSLWAMVVLLFVFPLISSIALAHSNAMMANVGAQTRNMLIDVLYRKSLTISPAKKLEISTGRILTMFSSDTNQIRNFLFQLNQCAIAPLQIGAILYLIWQQVGNSMFVGLGYVAFTFPVTILLYGMVIRLRRDKMHRTDMRVKLMNEVLNGIRIIKYYAWENAFVQKVASVRAYELELLRKMGYLAQVPFGIILLGAPNIQTTLIFLTYISLGNALTTSTSFTVVTLFGILNAPVIFLPVGLQLYSQSLISMQRIMEYLDLEDLAEYIVHVEPGTLTDTEGHDDVVLQFTHAHLSWSDVVSEAAESPKTGPYAAVTTTSDEGKVVDVEASTDSETKSKGPNRATHTLVDIHLSVRKGELVGIVGAVGSGKSSFLNAVLGEMSLKSGSVAMAKNQKIAYCDQRPWIVNATVRDNILFGLPYDEQRMNRAVYAAAMQDDLKILDAGLLTEIGERGINLSGGQKARACLARAVYNDADILLLDDPLSAVDAHVGEHIFRKCIKEELKGKTVLLVTHHLHVLPQCDKIIILSDNGSVLVAGTYDEIMRSGVDVTKFLTSAEAAADAEAIEAEVTEETDAEPVDRESENANAGLDVALVAVGEEATRRPSLLEDPSSAASASTVTDHVSSRSRTASASKVESTKQAKSGALMSKEERSEKDVPWSTYYSFIKAGGKWVALSILLSQLSSQALNVYANFWLTSWGKDTSHYIYDQGVDMPRSASFHWYRGYAGMLMGSIFLLTLSRGLLVYHRTGAAKHLHDQILGKVLFFPVAFFDVTPIGRIINRFSQDMATIDEDLATTLSQLMSMVGSVLGSLGAISGSTKGTFLILMVPLGVAYRMFNVYFRKANTAIARLESISRSPIYADFSQALSGTTTIRAYRQNDRFIHVLEDYANRNTVPGVLQQVASQWLSIRLDFLGALVIFFIGALAISTNGFISTGLLALGLSYSIQMTTILKQVVRVSAQTEAQFNSVERVYHYAHNIPTEDETKQKKDDDATKKLLQDSALSEGLGDIEMNNAALVSGSNDYSQIIPPEDWPQQGVVEFRNAKMRYRDGPLVLKGVSFKVGSSDHVGIAGRTGCGKSSLMVALFRIEDLVSGQILIDDIDIARVPLNTLRNKLCIIPQDPVMFSASVRFNLDPFDEHSDEEIWTVLTDVNMKEAVLSLPNKLAELVAEGGDNFSAGQRQLICIGRALLRKPKVLVMDEATASIDPETDNFIQKMIRQKFEHVTMLTIAHRLDTIIDSTRICVMDGGYVGEYDTPEALLSKEGGQFKGLWERHTNEGGNKH